jgi:hypothetical protein
VSTEVLNPPPPTGFQSPPTHRTWSWPVVGIFLITAGAIWHLIYISQILAPHFVDPTVPTVQVLHGTFGILTMLTALTQIFPGMRRRFPRWHRWNGRVYVFAGVLPCSVMLFLMLFAKGNPTNTADFFWGLLWLAVTGIAWRAARQRQYAKHRQFMFYSIALALVIPMSAALFNGALHLLPSVNPMVTYDVLQWLPWVVHLGVAHWYVTRHRYEEVAA